MPYIPKEKRKRLDGGELPETRGELAYVLMKEAKQTLRQMGESYMTHSFIMDSLSKALYVKFSPTDRSVWSDNIASVGRDCMFEWYRRYMGPYEQKKLEENGDVE